MRYLCFILSLMLAAHAGAFELQPLWTSEARMVMEGSAMLADLDQDGADDVVTAAYEHIIAVNGQGKELWRYDSRGRFQTCPALLERPGQKPLLYAGDNTGQFTCLDGGGSVVWQVELGPIFCASPTIADLDGNGSLEVLQGDKKGLLSAFDALTGVPLWTKQLEGECASSAVADIDSRHSSVQTVPRWRRHGIFTSTGAGKLYALSGSGEILWEKQLGATTPDWATCAPILLRLVNDWRVICASGDGKVSCLDTAGNILWDRKTQGAVASTLSAGDIDQDRVGDIFAITQLGMLYRWDESGKLLWEIDTQTRSLAPGAIVDLDGDGKLEYAMCAQNGSLIVLDASGHLQFAHQFPTRTINVTPAFGNLLPDRPGIELAITGGEAGKVFAFGAPATAVQGHWLTYRADQRLSGAWDGSKLPPKIDPSDQSHPTPPSDQPPTTAQMKPLNLEAAKIFSGQPLIFEISREQGSGLAVAEASCVDPDGILRAALGKVVGNTGTLQLPMSIATAGRYQVAWSLRDEKGARLDAGEQALELAPAKNEHALAEAAALALKQVMSLDILNANLHAALKQTLEALESGQSPDAVFAARALKIAEIAGEVLLTRAGSAVVAFPGTTWENRDVNLQLPDHVEVPLILKARGVPGEHVPLSVKLFNLSSQPVTVKEPTHPQQPPLQIFKVLAVPTNQGVLAWDPLVALGDGLEIPPLETREIWLDFDLTGVAPGKYPLSLEFTGASVQVELEVLDFQMAGYDGMRLCAWARYNDHAVKDLLAHGNTVFIGSLPTATVAGEKVELDTKALDEFVAPLKGHDIFLLLSGMPALDAEQNSDLYVARLALYLNTLFAHLKEQDIDEDHVALYPYDEPGGNGWNIVNKYIEFARLGLKARPGLKFYVNGGGDLPMFEAFNEVAAIWCPGFFMLPDDSAEMNFLRGTGKTLWTYDCAYTFSRPIGWNTKTINVVAQYRLAAPIAVNFNATGIGYWSYNIGPAMWDAKDPVEYPLVYSNEDGTITTCRRWEAVREGVEDARILLALREKFAASGLSPQAETKVKAVFAQLDAVSRQAMEESRLGLARYVLDASNNDQTVETLRELMLDAIATLGGQSSR